MDILYVLGDGSTWDNNELRFSLRSIEKHGKNVGRVFVVGGNKPDFLSDEVTFIKCGDCCKEKAKNIMQKVRFAAEYSDIDENFLFSADDHFYVKETDFDCYPIYMRGELPTWIPEENAYYRVLYNTRVLLEEEGLSTHDFSRHSDTHCSKSILRSYGYLFDRAMKVTDGVESLCVMLNIMTQKEGCIYFMKRDVKIDEPMNEEGILKAIGDNECFSIGEQSLAGSMRFFLEKMFPEKSKYESYDKEKEQLIRVAKRQNK